MTLRVLIFSLSIVLILGIFACGRTHSPENNSISEEEMKEPLLKANKYLLRQEEEDINDFLRRYKWDMQKSGTGLRFIIDSVGSGPKVAYGNIVTLHYKVKLLTGETIYDSEISGMKEFVAGRGGVEAGLEEGIKLLRKGDRAKFVLPSHLAFGLLGDEDKIPSRTPIIYELQVIDIK
jgi:FKBP-type peptidyl-prolyl cis-trans isomerase FkpA